MLGWQYVSARSKWNAVVIGALGGVLLLVSALAGRAPGAEQAAQRDAVRRGDIRGTLESGGLPRTYLLHVPRRYDPAAAWPLVFALHGGGSQGRSMPGLTGLSRLADRRGFLVAYPDGVGRSWNDGREDPDVPAQRQRVDDVAFLTALLDDLTRRYRVDSARVYATGISNGGFMSQRLACEASTRIAAVAPVVATLGVELAARCRPARPVPVLMVNGADDPLVPFQGGRSGSSGVFGPARFSPWPTRWSSGPATTAAPALPRSAGSPTAIPLTGSW